MIIYTDGSCKGNGKESNSGGYGVVVLDNSENLLYSYNYFSENTTNNREELKGILFAMIMFGNKKNTIVYSDSSYSINTLTDWMYKWEKNGWIKSNKKQPENLDLIKMYFNLEKEGRHIELKKVPGHSGQKWNEMADKLATGELKAINDFMITEGSK